MVQTGHTHEHFQTLCVTNLLTHLLTPLTYLLGYERDRSYNKFSQLVEKTPRWPNYLVLNLRHRRTPTKGQRKVLVSPTSTTDSHAIPQTTSVWIGRSQICRCPVRHWKDKRKTPLGLSVLTESDDESLNRVILGERKWRGFFEKFLSRTFQDSPKASTSTYLFEVVRICELVRWVRFDSNKRRTSIISSESLRVVLNVTVHMLSFSVLYNNFNDTDSVRDPLYL